MAIRLQKRIPIIGRIVWLNVSANGFSVSIGFRGVFSLNIGKRGVLVTLNIPVSGFSYRKRLIRFKSKGKIINK
jgi:hypothetical protein